MRMPYMLMTLLFLLKATLIPGFYCLKAEGKGKPRHRFITHYPETCYCICPYNSILTTDKSVQGLMSNARAHSSVCLSLSSSDLICAIKTKACICPCGSPLSQITKFHQRKRAWPFILRLNQVQFKNSASAAMKHPLEKWQLGIVSNSGPMVKIHPWLWHPQPLSPPLT